MTPPASPLPPLKALAVVAAVPSAALMLLSLLLLRFAIAGGIAAGLAICLMMYAGIYSFVTGASAALLGSVGGRAGVKPGPFLPLFALVTVGKFVVIGLALYVLFRWLHVSLIGFAVGFITSQVAITVACVRSLTSTKLVG